jgi:hypothetical protein
MFRIFADHASSGTVLMFNTRPEQGEALGEYGATRCITPASRPPNIKRSPRVSGSACSDTLRMTPGQEDEQFGSVNTMNLDNVTSWPSEDLRS